MHGSPESRSESDVEVDPHLARTRETGGATDDRRTDPSGNTDPSGTTDTSGNTDHTEVDAPGTSGTGEAEEFVGRVAGRDLGYAGETGAEARAQAGETNP